MWLISEDTVTRLGCEALALLVSICGTACLPPLLPPSIRRQCQAVPKSSSTSTAFTVRSHSAINVNKPTLSLIQLCFQEDEEQRLAVHVTWLQCDGLLHYWAGTGYVTINMMKKKRRIIGLHVSLCFVRIVSKLLDRDGSFPAVGTMGSDAPYWESWCLAPEADV